MAMVLTAQSNVSIEAINSSLYYLHAATEEDENVLRSIESELEQQTPDGPGASGLPSETISRLNDFHRKPVGGEDSGLPPPPPPPPHRDGVANSGVRGGLQQSTHDHHDPSSPLARLRRDGQFTIPRRPVSSSGSSPTTANMSHISSQRFSYDDANHRTQQHLLPERSWSNHSETTKSSQTSAAPPSFRVTLIRRDTASGNQWNVGTISSSSADQGVIHIEISNPGYGKFIGNALPLSTATTGQSAAEILQQLAQKVQHEEDNDAAGKRAFLRDVVPIKHHHRHNHSSSGSLFNRSPDTSKLANAISAKMSRGYYSFQSPWNGTCSFVASINGGGLKCKHVIPGPAMSMDGRGHSDEVTVSELRYNIPFPLEQTSRPSSMASLDGGKEKGKRAALGQLITANLEKVQQRARAHSAAADEDRLDLSLAREAGGGGMSGKSAKLGKLVILDEGIKMLDLVVAASMGVWWRTSYEPSARNY
ncbi:hypothetical protein UA08_00631 [Talaromyces atroroseus]|uniref:Uncharacterized protein n=1 Tax=Talaromyces atroroseus TaxID=1441469 RepID=A0A225BAA7_TALAT|nr:hypothetical protein UA08_00631 [Talaromyces atroroseus]OKL63865.1 hypothetical protein UA08_00631 [Talaromyces atroroseus]